MKNRRALMFLLLSGFCGLFTVYAFQSIVTRTSGTSTDFQIETAPVVVAGALLPAGTEILSDHLSIIEWPAAYLPSGSFSGKQPVDKRIPKHDIAPGEPVMSHALLPLGSIPGLSSLIQDNHRAMSVKVDAVIGVAGFVKPQSRVDVLATFHKGFGSKTGPTTYSRTILQNVKVLAVDQTTESVPGSKPTIVSVVTLQVNPREAQILSFASAEGKLQLSLRNPADPGLPVLSSTVPTDLMDAVPAVQKPVKKKVAKSRSRDTVEIIRGSVVTREYL